jgi:endonuclease/exonuclease/phosphatase (EEP) superfamily protein YafD
VAILAIVAVMRVAGDRWWPATLLLFSPRWIWAVPFPFLVLLAAIGSGRRRRVWPLAISAALLLFGIMEFQVPWRRMISHRTGTQTLRLVTCNLHNIESNPEVLNAFIDQSNPDIILLQDYAFSREPRRVQRPGWYRFPLDGMYIASRYPFGHFENLLPIDANAMAYTSLGLPLGKAQCFAVDAPGGAFHLVNLHLASAHQAIKILRDGKSFGPELMTADSERRGEESMAISERVQTIGGPFIIAGDFNTPDDSIIFRRAWWRLGDSFAQAGFGFGTTYAKHHTWLRIDHILTGGGWRCIHIQTGPDVGSGHRPILAVLER